MMQLFFKAGELEKRSNRGFCFLFLLLLPPQWALAETLRVSASLVVGAPRVVLFHKNAAAERVAHLYCATNEVARAPCALLEERIRLRQQAHNAGTMLAQHGARNGGGGGGGGGGRGGGGGGRGE